MARRQKHMLEKLAYDLKDDVFLKRLNQVVKLSRAVTHPAGLQNRA
jgi:hypothetical protein